MLWDKEYVSAQFPHVMRFFLVRLYSTIRETDIWNKTKNSHRANSPHCSPYWTSLSSPERLCSLPLLGLLPIVTFTFLSKSYSVFRSPLNLYSLILITSCTLALKVSHTDFSSPETVRSRRCKYRVSSVHVCILSSWPIVCLISDDGKLNIWSSEGWLHLGSYKWMCYKYG